jgi:hypothetical protein
MDEHAEKIKRMSVDREGNEERYQYTVMDTAAWAKAGYSETGVEIYMRHGVGVNEPLIQSDKHRIIGWNSVHTYLRIEKPTGVNSNPQPKLKIFSTCSNMIREIPMARHDEVHPEDIDSTRTGNEHWDALDDLRYMLQSLRESRAPKIENAIEKRIRQMNEMDNNFNYQYSRT